VKFQRNIPLKNYTTFRIGGRAKYFCVVKTKDDLIEAIKEAQKKKLPFFILGGGSNLLVSDRGYNGLVIKIQNSNLKSQNDNQPSGEQAAKFKIFCEPGVLLSKLVSKSSDLGVTGLEWAAGIPGTMGGAVRGNAGAFEGEMGDLVKEVEVFNAKTGEIKKYKNKGCQFGYRKSIFKKNPNLIILSCQLQLKKGDKKKIKEKIQNYLDYRKKKHPKEPSAGSIFKNFQLQPYGESLSGPAISSFQSLVKKFPELKQFQKRKDIPVAFLIAQCGLTGKRIGGAQISAKHPNFIVNSGNARSSDVLKLIDLIKRKVKEEFNIKLEEEIQKLGF
jgi:UDP-N-acetylmuramate dehydrogenase